MWNLASSVSSFANGLTGVPVTRGRHSTGSYNVSTKSQKLVAQKSMRSALAERGGVIRRADGFEVFYGINEGADQKPLKSKTLPQSTQQPDGWDNFYKHGDIKQTPAKVEKVDWTTKHPNMTPEKENQDSPHKGSPKKSPATSVEPESPHDEEQCDSGEHAKVADEGKDSGSAEEVDVQKENSPVVEPSAKPPTMCAFSIATPATSFAPPMTGRNMGMPDAEPKLSAEPLEGDALAKHLMNRLSLGGNFNGNFNSKVEAFAIHTPAASFAPPQPVTQKARIDSSENDSGDHSSESSPTLSATVLEDDAPKNSTPRGEGKPRETRRVMKEVRAVATRAMAGIPERSTATAISSGYPSQANQAPRTFTISAARFPSVVASTGSTSGSGRPSTGSVVKSGTGSIKGRASVPGNFRPCNVTVRH